MDSQLELAKNTFDNIVDMGLSDQSDKLNKIMLVFTSAAVLFLPPQVIAGLFGMNVRVPFQDFFSDSRAEEELTFTEEYIIPYLPFAAIVLLAVLFSLTLFCLFRKSKLI